VVGVVESAPAHGKHRAAELWQMVLARMSNRVPAHVFATWFRPSRALSLEGKDLTLAVPSVFHHTWLKDQFGAEIETELRKEEPGCRLKLIIQADLQEDTPSSETLAAQQAGPLPVVVAPSGPQRERPPSNLNARYTFENYVAGTQPRRPSRRTWRAPTIHSSCLARLGWGRHICATPLATASSNCARS